MMKRIKLLPENLINQIAAGEVIERPASVVKEMVENSIDAGAGKIEIEVSNGCRDIRIADNGSGIHQEDIVLAFSRHATSKITKQKDLWAISTLGFRGEALASIISVAKVSCTTKTADAETGLKVTCANSQVTSTPIGCAVGTIMEVNDLFYNIPARMKFLKKPETELAYISEVVQNLALSHPDIAFSLISKKRFIFKTSGSGNLSAVIGEVYSKEIIKELCEVSKEDEQFGIKVDGFVSNPDFTRSNKKAIYTFINGRTVKCPIMSKAIDTAYKDLISSGRYPYAVLNISILPEELDVNVHPAKREVKYTNPNLIFNFIFSAVKNALSTTAVPAQKLVISSPVEFTETSKIIDFAKYTKPSDISKSQSVDFFEFEEGDIQEVAYNPPTQGKLEFQEDGRTYLPEEKPKIIGQLDNTYILVQTKEGLMIVDQHIAHERHLYEKLKEEKSQVSQLLLSTELIIPEPEQVILLKENAVLLEKYGYELEYVHDGVKLKKIPRLLAEKDPQKIIYDLINALESSPETIEDELLMKTACGAAVKAGERLSMWQMEELIISWQKTKFPKTCPHGRKIGHTIPRQEVAGFFGRQEKKE